MKQKKLPQFYTVQDLMDYKVTAADFRDHPQIKINLKNLTLTIVNEHYEIDLESITSGAQVADWILQISDKTWATNQLVGELVAAIDHATWMHFGHSPQHVFCPFGRNNTVDWRKKTITPP